MKPISLESIVDLAFQDLMLDRMKVASHICFEKPRVSLQILLDASNSLQWPFPLAASVCVVNERPIERTPRLQNDRMMHNAISKIGCVDHPALWIVDHKLPQRKWSIVLRKEFFGEAI
jgi:hypothetical protein